VLAVEKVVPVSYTEDTRCFTHIDKSDTCLVGDRGKNKIYVKGKSWLSRPEKFCSGDFNPGVTYLVRVA